MRHIAHWYSRCLSPRGSRVRIPLKPPRRDLGQVLHLQLPVALRRVNSDTVSLAVIGSTCESFEKRIEMDKHKTIQYDTIQYNTMVSPGGRCYGFHQVLIRHRRHEHVYSICTSGCHVYDLDQDSPKGDFCYIPLIKVPSQNDFCSGCIFCMLLIDFSMASISISVE